MTILPDLLSSFHASKERNVLHEAAIPWDFLTVLKSMWRGYFKDVQCHQQSTCCISVEGAGT
jgi:hypothetical protein